MTSIVRGIAALVVVVVAAIVVDGWILDVSRGGGVPWSVVAEGLVTGAVLSAVWLLARPGVGAVVAAAGLLVAIGAGWGAADTTLGYITRSPLTWASLVVLTVIAARWAATERGVDARDLDAHADA